MCDFQKIQAGGEIEKVDKKLKTRIDQSSAAWTWLDGSRLVLLGFVIALCLGTIS